MRISQGSYCAVGIWEQRKWNYKHNETHFFDVCWSKSTHMWMFMCETKTQWFIMSECEWGSKATEATAYVPYIRTSLPNHILCCDSQHQHSISNEALSSILLRSMGSTFVLPHRADSAFHFKWMVILKYLFIRLITAIKWLMGFYCALCHVITQTGWKCFSFIDYEVIYATEW